MTWSRDRSAKVWSVPDGRSGADSEVRLWRVADGTQLDQVHAPDPGGIYYPSAVGTTGKVLVRGTPTFACEVCGRSMTYFASPNAD